MCGPMLGLIGAGVSAMGTMAAANAQAAMSKYNAKVAKINAQAAVREGIEQSAATRDEYQTVAATQRANLAKAGVDINQGTSAIIAQETIRREEHAAATDIWRGRTEQTKFKNQETLLRAESKAQKQAGVIGAVSSLIGGISGMGGSFAGSPLSLGSA